MQTLGFIIREAREKKGLSVSDISAKTNIVARYIEAIENDIFDDLPAEIYVKGFLRIISRELGLDPTLMVALYKNQGTQLTELENKELIKEKVKVEKKSEKIEKDINIGIDKDAASIRKKKTLDKIDAHYLKEQELLLEGTSGFTEIGKKKSLLPKIIMIIIVLLLLGFATFFVVYRIRVGSFPFISNISIEQSSRERNIVDTHARIGVRKGDILYFKPVGLSATIEITEIGNNNIKANINGLDIMISRTSPLFADLNKNGIDDFKITLIGTVNGVADIELESIVEENAQNTNILGGSVASSSNVTYTGDVITEGADGTMYILKNVSQVPIIVECTARRFVYVRYFADNDRPNTVDLSTGRSITITAQEAIMITIGNAGEVVTKINGKSVVFGVAGQSVNKTIKWIKNPDNSTMFDLIVVDTK